MNKYGVDNVRGGSYCNGCLPCKIVKFDQQMTKLEASEAYLKCIEEDAFKFMQSTF